ncbi:unnamed protein product [Haemonchus placei]|uniref:ATP-cone domain-containing protein n=1 Tax=Haemonchus placei TaxID=6290 RepID=A0A0N4X1T3_HAEPC|nr:unnamed protein product [Haemonchus placei]
MKPVSQVILIQNRNGTSWTVSDAAVVVISSIFQRRKPSLR